MSVWFTLAWGNAALPCWLYGFMVKCAHKSLLQGKTKKEIQISASARPNNLPPDEELLFFTTSFGTAIQLCMLRENV